tara:strand:- start:22542 stop:22790 length:249 start_codon:yes stop_codon:yes gene_type:complete
MDDHHHQPLWPMIQGAANYAWNLIEEAWGMIWPQRGEQSAVTVKPESERAFLIGEMREVDGQVKAASDVKALVVAREDRRGG